MPASEYWSARIRDRTTTYGVINYTHPMNPPHHRLLAVMAMLALIAAMPPANATPDIVDRGSWQARPPGPGLSTWEEYGLAVPVYDTIVLHVTSMGYGSGVGEMRRIQQYQMDVRGFADIAYNYLIDANGTVFEGRPLSVVPAHAGRSEEADAARDIRLDPDYGAIGIVFSADTGQPLTRAQVNSAISLIGTLQTRHPVRSLITHTEVREMLEVRGLTPVGDYPAAACPGPGSVEQIIDIRLAVDPDFEPARYRDRFD